MVTASHMVEAVARGDARAAARACRLVDERAAGWDELLKAVHQLARRSWRIALTGNPGAGKSTLADALVTALRFDGRKVGVVAVDPTSPFSGGAILGDRIRMQRHYADEGVFIRSLATRGRVGGISRSTGDVVAVLETWGADVVLIETVGVGQDELEVTNHADSTAVVVVPGLGDDIQASKAGILEVADVFAVNKADRSGADRVVRDLEGMQALGRLSRAASPGAARRHSAAGHSAAGHAEGEDSTEALAQEWSAPIVKCVATKAEGVPELLEALGRHREWLDTPAGRVRSEQRQLARLVGYLRDALTEEILSELGDRLELIAREVATGQRDVHSACEELLRAFRPNPV